MDSDTSHHRGFCWILVTLWFALCGASEVAAGPATKPTINIAGNAMTEQYVLGNLRQALGYEEATVKSRKLDDAAIYRGLLQGKIDLGSVLRLPGEVGAKDFGRIEPPPTTLVLGHFAVTVCAPTSTNLRQLTIKQLGEIVSGKITSWHQLGARGGKIKLLVDQPALDFICSLTGAKPVDGLRVFSHPTPKVAWALHDLSAGETNTQCLSLSASNRLFGDKTPEEITTVPITSTTGSPVVPTLANICNGTYPLSRPWRLILRPGAPKLAGRCLELLRDTQTSKRMDHNLMFWLIEPIQPMAGNIRVAIKGWYYELKAAADAYKKEHPQVGFTFLIHDVRDIEKFFDGQVDVVAHTGEFTDHMGGGRLERYRKLFPKPLPAETIAYWPFAVIVHPKNSIRSISMEQLHRFVNVRDISWTGLGRETDGPIRLFVYHSDRIAKAIHYFDAATGKMREASGDERVPNGNLRRYRVYGIGSGKLLKTMASETDGLGIWHHHEKLAASGLKILPLVTVKGRPPILPTDVGAVASGHYPLRTSLRITVHPNADKTTQDFAKWLHTAEAARAMREARCEESYEGCQPHPVAPACLASLEAVPQEVVQKKTPSPGEAAFNEPVKGAVAVLPSRQLSMCFLMANSSHHGAYEQAIVEALATDGRLTIVDRTQLARVLEERKLEILGEKSARGKPIVAADVFVFSYLVSEGSQAFLRIQAIHGPTASLLGELKRPIDPKAPARFDPPLAESVARWWPGVLKRLTDARTRPVWAMVDVYAGSLEVGDLADDARSFLHDTLACNEEVFLAGRSSFGLTQQEVLLRLIGISRPRSAVFTPAADYVLEARMPAKNRMELRFRGGDLKLIEQTSLTATDSRDVVTAAGKWVESQVAKHPAKPQAVASLDVAFEDDWAREQARLEYKMAEELKQRRRTFETKAEKRILDKRHYEFLPEDKRELDRLEFRCREHFRRAAQLDPTWEEAAYAELASVGEMFGSFSNDGFSDGNRSKLFDEALRGYERFLKHFPKSKKAEYVLHLYGLGCMFAASKAELPPGIDERRIRLHWYRQGFEAFDRYIAKYTFSGSKTDRSLGPPIEFTTCLYWLGDYLQYADPPEAELESIVADWSRRYDRYPKKAPHSDFARLLILAHKKNRQGFLALLSELQKRWPNPKHPQWRETTGMVDAAIFRLFRNVGSSNSSFQLWHRGKRGIGDLPKVGYKPSEDEVPLHGKIYMYCRGCEKPLRAAVREYCEKQPHVEYGYLSNGQDGLDDFVHGSLSLFAYAGSLSEEEEKQLAWMHKGPPEKILLGYLKKPGDANSSSPIGEPQPVTLVVRPRRSEALNDFLKWLSTPAGVKVLADHGVLKEKPQPPNKKPTNKRDGRPGNAVKQVAAPASK